MVISGVNLTSTIENLAYSRRRCKRSIRRDIIGIAATELVTNWAVSRIKGISKELIRQSEQGTIKGVKTSSGMEHAASRIPIKEVNDNSC